MKKISLLSLALVFSLAFTSCSDEDSSLTNDQNSNLLKTFKVNRDATGAYSVDYSVADNTKVDMLLNANNFTRQYFLYSTDNPTESNFSQNLSLDNDQLKIGFVDTQSDKTPSITIIDDIKFARKSGDQMKLSGYSMFGNEDGTYTLDFSVKDNTEVDFVYNEEINTYEVHLEDGKGGAANFSRGFEKPEGEQLKIVFVNHFDNASAKSGESGGRIRKPIVIIQ